uniref:Uncharacterized protein n=1 Tax=Strongyloides papillosus TaxID=174720 RepID=A0A0N5CB61_STREA
MKTSLKVKLYFIIFQFKYQNNVYIYIFKNIIKHQRLLILLNEKKNMHLISVALENKVCEFFDK